MVCKTWRETQFKIANRAYYPFYHGSEDSIQSSCPWCATSRLFVSGCGTVKQFSSFWEQFLKYIAQIHQFYVFKDPVLCILGCENTPNPLLTSHCKNLPQWVHICLLVARRTLMKAWIHPTLPQISAVKQALRSLFLLEKLDNITQNFKSKWSFIARCCRFMEHSFSPEISSNLKTFLYTDWYLHADLKTGQA